jgi:HEAT repeat protein
MGVAFPHFLDEERAWVDLHRLTKDRNSGVRMGAALSLGVAFPLIPNKEEAWEDLHRLTNDKEFSVRNMATKSLGYAYPHLPDKNKKRAFEDLHRLTQDLDSFVRAFANFSLGRVSIFRATETESEESFRKELENALEYFERSLTENTITPSQLLLPFYRSFYKITLEGQDNEADIQKYTVEARSILRGSENEEKLLEIVENLKNILKDIHRLREAELETMKSNLNACMQYCNRVEESLEFTKLISEGPPIINWKLREMINSKHFELFSLKLPNLKTWQCVSCGTQLPNGAQFCPHCGKSINACSMCGESIYSGDEFVECPHCGAISHRNHVSEWIKEKDYCPSCKHKLSKEDITRMRLL